MAFRRNIQANLVLCAQFALTLQTQNDIYIKEYGTKQ